MVALVTALLLLLALSVVVTVADAARAPHWRAVAVERRQAGWARDGVDGTLSPRRAG